MATLPASLDEWKRKHCVSDYAMNELRMMAGAWGTPEIEAQDGRSESHVQSRVRLEASSRDDLFIARNNVGALTDIDGRPVRFGLANDSKKMNTLIKSGDLIGIYRRLVTQADVGTYIGQYVSAEIKEEGWTYTGAGREHAQMNWAQAVISYGGIALFYAGGSRGAFDHLPRY